MKVPQCFFLLLTTLPLLLQYRPDLMDLPTTNGDHTTGDGIKMTLAIGGKTINMEKVQVHPTGLVDPREPDAKVKFLAAEALRGVGGLLLQADGKRFCDELGHRDYVTGMMWENKFPIRLVLNTAASKEIEWHCKHYVGRGLMKYFKNGEELAKEIGIPPSELKKTFDEYNLIAEGKVKDPWGKKYFHNFPIKMDQDFHVAQMAPVLHYTMVIDVYKAKQHGRISCLDMQNNDIVVYLLHFREELISTIRPALRILLTLQSPVCSLPERCAEVFMVPTVSVVPPSWVASSLVVLLVTLSLNTSSRTPLSDLVLRMPVLLPFPVDSQPRSLSIPAVKRSTWRLAGEVLPRPPLLLLLPHLLSQLQRPSCAPLTLLKLQSTTSPMTAG